MEIITVMDNIEFNNKLKEKCKNNDNILIHPDISYLEGINEILEINNNIELIIINSMITTKELLLNTISNIFEKKKMQIIVFLEKEDLEFRKLLISFGLKYIFLNNQIDLNDLVNIIVKDQKIREIELEEEIRMLKEKLFYADNINKNNHKNIIKGTGLFNSKIFKTILSLKNKDIIKLNNNHSINDNISKYNKYNNIGKNLNNLNNLNTNTENTININVQEMIKNIKEITLTLNDDTHNLNN